MCLKCGMLIHCDFEDTIEALEKSMDYIVESEMEGRIDKKDSWYPTYIALKDLKEKVLEELNN